VSTGNNYSQRTIDRANAGPALSMVHWNGDQCVAFDIETTGLDPFYHEIVQIAAVPLTSNFEIRKDYPPFLADIAPENPERADPKALARSGLTLTELTNKGYDTFKAMELFVEWTDKLGLTYTKHGNRKRIIPLGHNIMFDLAFIRQWITPETYELIFSAFVRDTMLCALHISDCFGSKNEEPPYGRYGLNNLCAVTGVPYVRAHSAMGDACMAAAVYKEMCKRTMFP